MALNFKHKSTSTLLTFLFLLSVSALSSQRPMKVHLGAGFSEGIHASFSYRISHFEPILSYGKSIDDDADAYSGGIKLYGMQKSKITGQTVWFMKLLYTNQKIYYAGDLYTTLNHFNVRLGREINFTARLGIELDIGLRQVLDWKYMEQNVGGSISLIYRP